MIHSNLLYLDFEGTGTDPYSARIVELCLIRAGYSPFVTRVNPRIRIPPEATAVHGITDEDVKDAPTFAQLAPRVQEMVKDAVLVGYNLRRYDTILLDAELRRAEQPGLPRTETGALDVQEIDLFRLWSELEPRTLAGAAKRFAGRELKDAHSAKADTEILPAILHGMVMEFGLSRNIDKLAELSVPAGEVDRDGKFVRREDGVILFNFSKQRGQPAKEDPGLLHWIINRDFSAETKAVAYSLLEELSQERIAALEQQGELAMAPSDDDDDDLPF